MTDHDTDWKARVNGAEWKSRDPVTDWRANGSNTTFGTAGDTALDRDAAGDRDPATDPPAPRDDVAQAVDPTPAGRGGTPAGPAFRKASDKSGTRNGGTGKDGDEAWLAGVRQPKEPTADQGPDALHQIKRKSWLNTLKGTAKQTGPDKLTTWAAALTYYAILSIFPGLLVLVSALRLAGTGTMNKILGSLTQNAPGPAKTVLTSAIQNLQSGASAAAGVAAVIGVLAALWSASGYVGSFMQAANSIYDVPEGRPIWTKLPIRLGITVVAGIIVSVSALAVVLTGGLAKRVGDLIGLGPEAVSAWDIAKWPVIVVLISLLFALLFWAAPNARQGGFRWVTPGSVLATVIWLAASALFALYVSMFASYNKTYGSLAAVIVFLVWLWISNLAILFGAEFDAELQRNRAAQVGHPADEEPYMRLRDTRKLVSGRTDDL